MRMTTAGLMGWTLAACLILGASREVATLVTRSDAPWWGGLRFAGSSALLLVTWSCIVVAADRDARIGVEPIFPHVIGAVFCSIASVACVLVLMHAVA